jgi:hypothetical protein
MIQPPETSDSEDGTEDAAILLEWLSKTIAWNCADCGASLCGHDRLLSRALIGIHSTRCIACMARRTHSEPAELDSRLNAYICRRACYAAAWASIDSSGCTHSNSPKASPPIDLPTTASAAEWDTATEKWDAADLGCGDLVLPLRGKLRANGVGCRLTGHLLVASTPPEYLIQRRSGD